MVAGALVSVTLLKTSLYRTAEQEAGREARIVADMGLASALSHGRLSPRDLVLASSQYEVARRDLPLTGVVIWLPSGKAVFDRGSHRVDAAEPHIATVALATDTTQVADTIDAPMGATVEAAVPLGTRALRVVAEFHFARAGIQRTLSQAEGRVYVFTGIDAVIMYLAILPLLARLATRLPLPDDPFRRAAQAGMREALTRRELVVHYQPKVEIETGRPVGVEALVRWNHPRRGLLSPDQFLSVAESSPDLLSELTGQVLACAVRDCAGWRRDGCELPVAVNVAPAVLLDGPLVALIKDTLSRYELDAHMLTVELTENALMQPQEHDVTEHLKQLRELGISVSIDDFGTGNSSLSRLRSLPLDELKIDRTFIAGISTDERDLGITRHIVNLGLELGLRVVAEGVEDERTLRLLRALDCEVAQGFHLARPMSEEQLRRWITRTDSRPPAPNSSAQPCAALAATESALETR